MNLSRARRLVVLTTALAAFLSTMLQTIIVPLSPTVARHYGAAVSDVTWIVTATLLSGVAASASVGPLSARYGVRRVFVLLQGVSALGSILAFLPLELSALIAARGFQGVGLAAIPLSMTILRNQLPKTDAPGGVAVTSAMVMIGGAGGNILSATIATVLEWRSIFVVTLVLSLCVGTLGLLTIQPGRMQERPSLDVGGIVLLPLGVTFILLALIKGPVWGINGPTIITAGAGIIFITGWLIVESLVRVPVFPLRLVLSRKMLPLHFASLAAGFAVYCTLLAVPQLLQSPFAFDLDVLPATLLVFPTVVAGVAGALTSGRISRTQNPRFSLVIGASFACGGLVVLWLTSGSLLGIVIAGFISAFGASVCYAAIPLLIMERTALSETGVANSVNTVARSIGGALATTVLALVVSLLPSMDPSIMSIHAFRVFVMFGACTAGTIVIAATCIRQTGSSD